MLPTISASTPTTRKRVSACAPRGRKLKRSPAHAQVALLCKALSDHTRLSIMQMITEAGELCACEVECQFALSQPTISHHLKLLREAGLIEGERRGNWIYYRAVEGALSCLTKHPLFREQLR